MSKEQGIKDRVPQPINPTKNKETKITRVPRPQGLTMMSMHLQGQTNEERIRQLKQTIIGKWTMNNFTINGQPMTSEQLGTYLNIGEAYVMKYMLECLKGMGKVMEKVEAGDMARAIFSHCLKKGLEIQAMHQVQAQSLLVSQGAGYQPFVSMAVNQALANLNSTQTPILALLKQLVEKTPTNIIINNPVEGAQAKYLTTDEAVKLIGPSQPSMLEDLSQADAYILTKKALPDVGARTQDLRGIGIRHDGTQSLSAGLPLEAEPQPKRDKEDRIPRTNNAPAEILDEEDFVA